MKTYLVAVDLGARTASYKVEMPESYVPVSDDMKKLKQALVKQHSPKFVSAHAAPDNCGGYISYTESNMPMKADSVRILAVSRLDL